MTWLEALILGILQGLAEFLPISSSGHLEVGEWLLNVKDSNDKRFTIVVHVATALATIITFWPTLVDLLRGVLQFRWNDSTRYVSLITVSMIPILVVGLLFKDAIDALFDKQIVLVGSMFLLTAALIVISERLKTRQRPLDYLSAFVIGVAQTIAVLPGLSRSGATITTALMLGIDRQEAARFSFLMVLVPILGMGLLEAKDLIEEPVSSSVSPEALAIGFVAALGTGLLACRAMIAIVRRRRMTGFAVYLVLLGVFVLTKALLS